MRRFLGGALVAAALSVQAVQAQTDDTSFAGETITIVVGFNPGGTYDLYARVGAEWLRRYIPGNPNIVVENMPGAGGRLAANYLASQASADGLTIGTISQAAALQQVLREEGAGYDVRELNWIGRFTPVVEVTAVWNESTAVRSIEDAMQTTTVLSGTSADGTSNMMPTVMNEVVGTQFNIILGYPGTTGAQYAMESGEVEGAHSTVSNLLTNHPQWLADDVVTLLVQYSDERHPELPDVPAMTEFGTTEEESQILALFASTAALGRSLVAPAGVPEDRIETLRAAFDAMVADPEFAQALADLNLDFGPLSGAELQSRVSAAVTVTDAVGARARELVVE